jgi:SNF2 family DNA or RNA helicase
MDIDSDNQDSDVQEISHNGESQMTPHRQRRKRAVAESQFAISKRSRNRITAKAWEDRSKIFLHQQQLQSSELGQVEGGIVVNTGKEEDDKAIMIGPHLAASLKAHQIDGIRFMWREVVGTADDSEEAQGCLLAHTMGLGKTIQVYVLSRYESCASLNQT